MTSTSHRIPSFSAAATFGLLLAAATLLACGGGTDSLSDGAYAGQPGAPVERDSPATPGSPAAPGVPTQPGAPGDDGSPTQPSSPTEPGQPTPPAVKVAFADVLPNDAFTPLTKASIESNAVVYVVADWSGVSADQAERLTLVSPGGSTYYATQIPLADASTSLVNTRVLPDGTRRVAFKLIIWGSTIESYGDVGTWTATASLVDGNATATATFELE